MIEDLEQRIDRAIATFVGTLLKEAERAAIESIQSAFATVRWETRGALLAPSRPPSATERARGRASTPSSSRRQPRPPTMTGRAALAGRIVTCVHDHPGSTVVQLAPKVGLHETTLRRHLHRLAQGGQIRTEEQPSDRFGGQPRRSYYATENASGARADASGDDTQSADSTT
jgi:hypothetical protein